MIWRVGQKLGRTLYCDEVFVGTVDTPELAAAIVEAMNDQAVGRIARALRILSEPLPAESSIAHLAADVRRALDG